MLLSTIDKNLFDKMSIAEGFLDQLKLYINPEIYKFEKNPDDQGTYDKVNIEFDKQTAIGRSTGMPQSGRSMKEAIAEFYEWRENPEKHADRTEFIKGSLDSIERTITENRKKHVNKNNITQEQDESDHVLG